MATEAGPRESPSGAPPPRQGHPWARFWSTQSRWGRCGLQGQGAPESLQRLQRSCPPQLRDDLQVVLQRTHSTHARVACIVHCGRSPDSWERREVGQREPSSCHKKNAHSEGLITLEKGERREHERAWMFVVHAGDSPRLQTGHAPSCPGPLVHPSRACVSGGLPPLPHPHSGRRPTCPEVRSFGSHGRGSGAPTGNAD